MFPPADPSKGPGCEAGLSCIDTICEISNQQLGDMCNNTNLVCASPLICNNSQICVYQDPPDSCEVNMDCTNSYTCTLQNQMNICLGNTDAPCQAADQCVEGTCNSVTGIIYTWSDIGWLKFATNQEGVFFNKIETRPIPTSNAFVVIPSVPTMTDQLWGLDISTSQFGGLYQYVPPPPMSSQPGNWIQVLNNPVTIMDSTGDSFNVFIVDFAINPASGEIIIVTLVVPQNANPESVLLTVIQTSDGSGEVAFWNTSDGIQELAGTTPSQFVLTGVKTIDIDGAGNVVVISRVTNIIGECILTKTPSETMFSQVTIENPPSRFNLAKFYNFEGGPNIDSISYVSNVNPEENPGIIFLNSSITINSGAIDIVDYAINDATTLPGANMWITDLDTGMEQGEISQIKDETQFAIPGYNGITTRLTIGAGGTVYMQASGNCL